MRLNLNMLYATVTTVNVILYRQSHRISEKCDMFAPDRQGFFPGLWVQLLQDLSTADREAFASLATRAERLQWMYDRSFVKVRPSIVCCVLPVTQANTLLYCWG